MQSAALIPSGAISLIRSMLKYSGPVLLGKDSWKKGRSSKAFKNEASTFPDCAIWASSSKDLPG